MSQPEARLALEEYSKVAHAYGLTPPQLALAWVHSQWFVASTIIGATSLAQLKVTSSNQTPKTCEHTFCVPFYIRFPHLRCGNLRLAGKTSLLTVDFTGAAC